MKRGGVAAVILGALLACLAVGVTGGATDGPVLGMAPMPRRSMTSVLNPNPDDEWDMPGGKDLLKVAGAGKHPVPQNGSKETDFIEALPGQPKVDFKQYAGYMTVDDKAGRALFYYFTEAVNSSLPLVLWLNGGPGCSSVGAGGFTALGPFRVNADGKTLKINPDAWNQEANIIFLEAPAGVGFSYSNVTRENFEGNDTHTSSDNLQFLVNWFERFPEYKGRNFYIAGESYAGAYVSTLSYLVSNYNKMANKTLINLKGVLLGNAYLGKQELTQGEYDNLFYHSVISKKVHENLVNCIPHDVGLVCDNAWNDLNGAWNALDFYDMYNPVQCNQWKNMSSQYFRGTSLYDCTREPMTMYLNDPKVQEALHVVPRPRKSWTICNDDLHDFYIWTERVVGYLQSILNDSIPVMIYNGDTDLAVPIAEARLAIKKLKLTIRFKTRPWFSTPIEVGGFTTVYQKVNDTARMTFATVRGGGHMAPMNQGPRSIHIIRSFLKGEQLPWSYLAPKNGYECC